MQKLPQFTKINESFKCHHCGCEVPPSQRTCRDHCPECLYSLHVDNNPGDRAADCGGSLKPVGYSSHPKKGYMIHYKCEVCGEEKRNRFLEEDATQPDNFDTLLKLTPEF